MNKLLFIKITELDISGGAVDKNPPADAGDTGSAPGPGKFCSHGALKPLRHSS